jgi:hypothetical protein
MRHLAREALVSASKLAIRHMAELGSSESAPPSRAPLRDHDDAGGWCAGRGGEIIHLEGPCIELEERAAQDPHPQSWLASVSCSSFSRTGCRPICWPSPVSRATGLGARTSRRRSDVRRRRRMSRGPGVGGKNGTEQSARAECGPRERGYRSLGSHRGLRVHSACQRYWEDAPLQ